MSSQKTQNNIFLAEKQSNSYIIMAQQLFGRKNNQNKCQSEKIKQDKNNTFKRTNFKNEIRRKQIQNFRISMRSQLIKILQNQGFIKLIENQFEKQQFNSKTLTNLLTDLRRNMHDRDFCCQIQQNSKIKQYLLKVYQKNIDQLQISQKIILIECLVFLTYYGTNCFSFDQIIYLNNLLKMQVQNMKQGNHQNMYYLLKITQLLINLAASYQEQQNYQLMDSQILTIINNKIEQFQKQLQNYNEDTQQYREINQVTNELKNAIISVIINLSNPKYQNQNFFMSVINNFIMSKRFLNNLNITTKVFKILNNFFINNTFRSMLLNNSDFCAWYTQQIVQLAQSKYSNPYQLKTGQFKNHQLSIQQRDVFSGFLSNLITWIQQDQDQQFNQQTKIFIQQNLDGYLLSEFLILSASSQKKNSKHVYQAFKILQYLAYDPYVTKQQLLIVRKGRYEEQILKVFLDSTYFTSIKTSQTVLSFLNKLLSKDSKILETFMQLRIFQCIKDFFQIQIPKDNDQIIKIFDLLMIMIASEDDIIKDNNSYNRIISLIQKDGLLKYIQKYQDYQSKQVTDKVEMFLKYFQAKSNSSAFQDKQLQI